MKKDNYKFCPYCGEPLNKKEIESQIRQYCQKCDFINYINPTPVVAVLVVQEKKILFIKRKYEPARHRWALPGGFIDYTEDPKQAAKRELKEETALESFELKLIGLYTHMSPVHGPILTIAYQAVKFKGTPQAGDDAEDIKYYNKNELPEIPFKSHQNIVKETLKWL